MGMELWKMVMEVGYLVIISVKGTLIWNALGTVVRRNVRGIVQRFVQPRKGKSRQNVRRTAVVTAIWFVVMKTK